MKVENKAQKLLVLLALLMLSGLALFVLQAFTGAPQAAGTIASPAGQSAAMTFGAGAAPQITFTSRYTYIFTLVYSNRPITTIFGVEMNSISAGAGLAQVAAADTTWVRRAGLWWPDVEPTQGARDWTTDSVASLETELVSAAQNNLKTVLVVRGTPGWAAATSGNVCGPVLSSKLQAFGNFMYDVVDRYSRPPYKVGYIEIVNEPDVDPSLAPANGLFGCWGVKNDTYYGGGAYASMLKVVYPRMKQANPNIQVLVGGLLLNCDPVHPPGNLDCTPSKFIEGILKGGGGPYFDGIAFHSYEYYPRNSDGYVVYSNSNWNSTASANGPAIIAKTNYLRSLLTKYNVTGKYLMATEVALLCNSNTTACAGSAIFETAKAIYVAQIYPTALALNLKAEMWYSVMGWPEENTGILNADLTPRPAYTTFEVSRAMLADATYTGVVTTTDVGGVTGTMGYKFLVNGKRVWTVWSKDGSQPMLTLPALPYAIFDMMGTSVPVSPTNKVQLLAPNQLFIYIQWDQ